MRAQHAPPWLVPWLVAFGVVLGCAGCKAPLVGLHDLVIRFAISGEAPAAKTLHEQVVERLSVADVAAEVDTSVPGEVSVRVDEDLAGEVGRLLLWPGGVSLAVVDDDAAAGVLRVTGAPRDEVTAALARTKPPSGHAYGIEPLPDGLARRRTLEWPPVVQLATEGAVADGPRVRLAVTPSEDEKLASLTKSRPDAMLAVMRGRTVLAVRPAGGLVNDHVAVVPMGDGIAAYTEAADLAHLLATPRLPVLHELAHGNAKPDWLLGAANLLVPFAMSFAWLFFVRQFDRARPEPMWLVALTFVLGAVAVVPAGLIEWGWDAVSAYTNPTLLTLGRAPRAFPIALVGFIVTVGLTEEGMKMLAAWSVAGHRREFDEPVDGIVYGAAAALGFAAAENIRYLALGRVDGPLVASRAFMSVPAHLFFGTIWGYALGRRLVQPGRSVWPLFLAAAALHGLFDTCLAIDGATVWAFLIAFGVASLFVFHLRSSLRYGPVGVTETPNRGARELFPMGSRLAFAAFVAMVYLFAGVVFLLALFGQDGRSGVAFGVPFGVASTLALGLLGWAARGLALSLPLDAVVDDIGVTFAGAALPLGEIVRVERRRLHASPGRREQLLVIGDARRLTVGPAPRAIIDSLSHAISARLAQRGGGGEPPSGGAMSTPSLPAANASSTSS